MSAGKRAYDLMRGYINREWDRIQGLERYDAQRELDEALEPGGIPSSSRQTSTQNPPADPKAHAREILGVAPDAPFAEIRKAFEKLNKRSDPTKFPAGSIEAAHAADIQKRVQWAYNVLSEGVDATERRFRSLEID